MHIILIDSGCLSSLLCRPRLPWKSPCRRRESEIRCGILNGPPAGGITAWIAYSSRREKATFYGTIVGDRQVLPAADRMAAWLHETALRLFPDSPYAKEHGG